MRLALKNIAKIKQADIELNGITVIAGENNTGKSTVGKALYSVFNSLYQLEKQVRYEKKTSIANVIMQFYMTYYNRERFILSRIRSIAFTAAEAIMLNSGNETDIIKILKETGDKYFEEPASEIRAEDIEDILKRIKDIIGVSEGSIFRTILLTHLTAEFGGQINNIYNAGTGMIELSIRNNVIHAEVEGDKIKKADNVYDLNTEAVYIDDPFVLDKMSAPRIYTSLSLYSGHKNDLIKKLSGEDTEVSIVDEIITGDKLENIYSKINSVCTGQVTFTKNHVPGYIKSGSDKILNIQNISAGVKTFVILKTLLENGTLKENGTVIMDEPEIHLHPQWQVLFAELIVLLQKEFNMNILLNTHSPYFMRAIEAYSAVYATADKCRYYLAHTEDDMAVMEDVTEEPEKIYRLLATPMQYLENVVYEHD